MRSPAPNDRNAVKRITGPRNRQTLSCFCVLYHRPDIDSPSIGFVGWAKRPAHSRFAAARTQAETFVIAVHFVKTGGTWSNFDKRVAVLMEEYRFGSDNDGCALLVPARVALTGSPGAPESEIVSAVDDSLLVEACLKFRRKFAGLLLASHRCQGNQQINRKPA